MEKDLLRVLKQLKADRDRLLKNFKKLSKELEGSIKAIDQTISTLVGTEQVKAKKKKAVQKPLAKWQVAYQYILYRHKKGTPPSLDELAQYFYSKGEISDPKSPTEITKIRRYLNQLKSKEYVFADAKGHFLINENLKVKI